MNKTTIELPWINSGIPTEIYFDIDRFIREIINDREYESLLDNKKNMTVVDLGCNIGTFSLYIYDRAKKIYAFDLSPKCIEIFDKTIEKNNLHKIETLQVAVAGKNKVIRTTLDRTDGGSSIYKRDKKVFAVTLATLLNGLEIDHVDLLKVDIEGAEDEVFNASDIGEVIGKIDRIIGECHNGFNITETMERFGYKCVQNGVLFYAV